MFAEKTMSIVLMRKLTAKSLIGFGRFTDLTIQNLIDMLRHKEVLEIYYFFRNIDFCEELKQQLFITGDRVIDKSDKSVRFEKDQRYKINSCLKDIINAQDGKNKFIKMGLAKANKKEAVHHTRGIDIFLSQKFRQKNLNQGAFKKPSKFT